MSSHYEKRAEGNLSMSLTLLIHLLANLSSKISGAIQEGAWVIMYPGANGDAWWDAEQMLKQVCKAIKIFEAAHSGKQALFIFDQSSAHASLPPDALKPWMEASNESNKTQSFPCQTRVQSIMGRFRS